MAPSPAHALPVFDLIFTATTGSGTPGSATIAAAPGDLLTLELRLRPGPEGVSAYGVSLVFDADLRNELDLESVLEFLPPGYSTSFTPGRPEERRESTASIGGRILTFEAFATGDGPVSGSLLVGLMELRVNSSVASDGVDLALGLFNPGIDGVFDNAGNDLSAVATFGAASVAVPEPGAGTLGSLGLAALGALRRRRAAMSIPATPEH